MNPHYAEDKIIYISRNSSAFAYKYWRKKQNDFYCNLDYRHHQITIIVDTHEECVTQYEIFEEGLARLTEDEPLVDLVILHGYKKFGLCLN